MPLVASGGRFEWLLWVVVSGGRSEQLRRAFEPVVALDLPLKLFVKPGSHRVNAALRPER